MKPTAALLFGVLALAACQEADKSYDAMHAPENVLGAPLFSEANRQQDATNRKLMDLAKKDSLFFIKKKAAAVDTAALGTTADSADPAVAALPAPPAPPAAPVAASAPKTPAAPHAAPAPKGPKPPKPHK